VASRKGDAAWRDHPRVTIDGRNMLVIGPIVDFDRRAGSHTRSATLYDYSDAPRWRRCAIASSTPIDRSTPKA